MKTFTQGNRTYGAVKVADKAFDFEKQEAFNRVFMEEWKKAEQHEKPQEELFNRATSLPQMPYAWNIKQKP